MNVIHSAREFVGGGRKACLALGFFDGVHLGHQAILRQTLADAGQHGGRAVVVTFDRHPNTVVAPRHVPPLIYPLSQKLRAIESLGPDTLLLLHFDQAFSEQSGADFIHALVRDLGGLASVCVGARFTFGHRRSGDVELLRKLGAELGFAVHGLDAVSLDGQMVSSTRARQAILTGALELAGRMLGRPYSFSGRVVAGDRLGRKQGFPTANLDTTGLALPPRGVYAVRARWRGLSHPAVLNIGVRPTLREPNPSLRVEAHLLDFQGDLYGEELEVVFAGKLREEQKFRSVEELRLQIARDIAQARTLLQQG
jgi:riboflavin kinase/FMN adenylyltransferase